MIQKFKELEELDISYNKLTYTSAAALLKILPSMKNLKTLYIQRITFLFIYLFIV